MESFNLKKIDIDTIRELRSKFIKSGYNETAINKKLNLFNPYLKISPLHFPLLKYLVNTDDSFDILVSLFFLKVKMGFDRILKLFTKDELEKLSQMNILKLDLKNESVESRMAVYPLEGLFFFTNFTDIRSRITRNDIYMIGLDSYLLAKAIPKIKVDSVLDLCSGSGIQSIVASKNSKSTIGVDINTRAINFGKFNILFNDANNIDFKLGSLYEPINNKKFNIIVSNPPFVSVPYDDNELLYRDSGKDGEYFFKMIVNGIPKHLEDDGICLIYTEIKKKEGIANIEVIQNLIGNNKFKVLQISIINKCTCTVCYSVAHNMQKLARSNFKQYEKDLVKWYKNLEENGIKDIIPTIICIKKDDDFHLSEIELKGKDFSLKDIVKDFYYSY